MARSWKNRKNHIHSVCESLERRAYLSIAITDGIVSVQGTAQNDTASVLRGGHQLSVTIGSQTQSFPNPSVQGIVIDLGPGDDTLTLGAKVGAVSVNGGGGNDSIVAGNSAADSIHGGAGSDTLDGGGAGSQLLGGDGNDLLAPGSAGESVLGGHGNDTIAANDGNDSLAGGSGADFFLTETGSGDSIDGGAGLNFAQRNAADSFANISEIFDPKAGAPNPPPAGGGAGGGGTQITAHVSGGILDVLGAAGNTSISVALHGSHLRVSGNGAAIGSFPLAGISAIRITGFEGNDTLAIDSSVLLPATLIGGYGNDSLSGGGGNNVLIGGRGNDTLLGGGGTNLLVPADLGALENSPSGNDLLEGGSGLNIADFAYRLDGLVLSNDGKPDSGDVAMGEATTIMPDVTAILGGTGADTITGTVGDEFLSGGGGADSIQGGGANDVLVGGRGSDSVAAAAQPVALFLRDGVADQYTGAGDPSQDVLQVDPNVDFSADGPTDPITPGNITVALQTVANVDTSTYGTPQDIAAVPGDNSELLVNTRNGYVLILKNGVLQPTPLLSLAAAGITVYTGGEGGLLGLAISPDFATPGAFGFGQFYTVDTENFSTFTPADYSSPELYPTTDVDPNNQIVLREWTIDPNNPDAALTTSRVLLRIDHPQSNHQGGSLRFGPDGDLYLGLGDGGGADDQNGGGPDDPTDGHTNDIGNAQDLTVPFGKILRINPNPSAAGATISTNGQYSIPDDNPFFSTGGGVLKEIFAYGLRNPYRMAFDSVTGQLYVSDVGQNQREELDAITSGGNYGWPFLEGTRDNSAEYGHAPPAGFTSIAPLAEYTHSDGNATIGGIVYRGTDDPALYGDYLFGDLDSSAATPDLFYVSTQGGTIHDLVLSGSGASISGNLYGISQDASGQPYYFFSDGSILTIAPQA